MIYNFKDFLNEYENIKYNDIIDNKEMISNIDSEVQQPTTDYKFISSKDITNESDDAIDREIYNKLEKYKISVRELLTRNTNYNPVFHGRPLSETTINEIIDLWESKYNDVSIYYYDFEIKALGISLGEKAIAINRNFFNDKPIDTLMVFVLIHELGHTFQRKGMNNDANFLKNIDDKQFIIKKIKEIEDDASDFAYNTLENIDGVDMGFIRHIMQQEPPVDMVYDIMLNDINELKPRTLLELFYKQTLKK